jgi:hypothetical protein
MTLHEKLASLDVDDVYQTLITRLATETDAILAGAGDESNWLALYNQVVSYEQGVLNAST